MKGLFVCPLTPPGFCFPNHFAVSLGAIKCRYGGGISLHLESQALLLPLLAAALPDNSHGPCWTTSTKAFGPGPNTAAG